MPLLTPRARLSRSAVAFCATAVAATALAVPASAVDQAGPVADAGPDQTVTESSVVQLDGSASTGATRPTLTPSAQRGTLPGGTAMGVELVGLDPDAATPTARGAVDLGQGPGRRDTSVAYVVDTSGSTEDPGRCGGDANGDGLVDTILDCEIAAAIRLHDEVMASGTVDTVALVNFSGQAFIRDLDPTEGGVATLVAPDADADGNGVPDLVDALRSLRHGGATDFVNASSRACEVLAGAGSDNLLGVFLSDGIGEGDLRTVVPCAPPVTFHVFAAGAGSSCTAGFEEWSRLQDLADLSGGTCRSVPDVADLPDLLPEVIASEVTGVAYSVDGGPSVDLAADLGLPRSGPVRLDLRLPLPAEAQRVCVTVTGRDSGGTSSETTCSDVVDGSTALTHSWRQVSGLPASLSGAGTAHPTFVADDDGRQVFELTVTDATGRTATDLVSVDTGNVAPQLVVQHQQSEADGQSRVSGTVTDVGLRDTQTVRVTWGDGAVDTLPVTVEAPGRGSFVATHTYAGDGSYDIEVVATDDDGGSDRVVVRSVVVRSPVAVWANSTSSTASLDWTGGAGTIWGRVHTNGRLRFVGDRKAVVGPSTHAGPLAADTTRNSFSPAPVAAAVQPFPFRPDLASYRPGGDVAREVGAAYRDMSSRCTGGAWSTVTAPLAPGVYYASCDIQLSGADLAGKVTLVSEGRVKLSGSRPTFEPYTRGYLAIAGAAGSRAIDISASSSGFTGVLFAEHGQISVSGAGNRFQCGILGDQVSITGSDTDIRAGGCGGA